MRVTLTFKEEEARSPAHQMKHDGHWGDFGTTVNTEPSIPASEPRLYASMSRALWFLASKLTIPIASRTPTAKLNMVLMA